MSLNWQSLYAKRTARMHASDIREILKLSGRADIISLAGGLPAPELFPIDEFRRAFDRVLRDEGAAALQYSTTEGYLPLRAFLAARLTGRGQPCQADDILITNGSQQALDLIGRTFLDPGDRVVVENPSYMGALQAFNQYEPTYAVVPTDDEGIRVDALERLLAAARADPPQDPPIKLIYTVPNFQNPTGRTLSLERRRRLVELSSRYAIPLVEDDPYGELRYEGEPLPSLMSLDSAGTVIYLGTFSKILAPGFRLGWIVARPDPLTQLLLAKQPSDLHTGVAAQMATYRVVENGFLEQHIETLKAFYRERRDALLRALEEYFPVGAVFSRPHGGLFVWAELPAAIDTRELLPEALQAGVVYVPGQGFHADGAGANTMRLNFSNVPPAALREGVQRLGTVVQRRLDRTDTARPAVLV